MAERLTNKRLMAPLVRAVCGSLVIAGLLFAYVERRYAPDALLPSQSTILPSWIGWTGYLFALVAAVIYNITDYVEWWRRR